MSRREIVWLGLLLLVVTGCTPDTFLTPFSITSKYRRVVSGSPSRVSNALEDGFGNVGITVFAKRDGDEIRMAGQTKTGDVFCVYVRPAKEPGAKSSVVTVKWDHQPDEQLWKSIVEWIAPGAPQKDGSAEES